MTSREQPMKGFYIYSRSHYARPGHDQEIMIGLYYPSGGCDAEFGIRWKDLGSKLRLVPRLEVFDDSWKMFFEMEELRGLSALTGKNATEQEIVDFLLSAGFTDLTRYEGPKAQKPTITVVLEGGIVQDVTGLPAGYELRVEDHDEGDADHHSWDEEKKCFVTIFDGEEA
jgi:hypothetical protein